MTADRKRAQLDQIIEQMSEATDASEISNLYDRGYEYAVGSNSRKNELRSARDIALARVGE